MRSVQRNINPPGAEASTRAPAGGFASPHDVPRVVSPALALANLAEGRPEGEESEITVRGLRCPLRSAGKGAPILCVPGLGHDAWDFASLFAARPEGTRLVVLDLPGFGLADKPDDADLALLEDAVLQAREALDAPPVVIGSSLGGHVAMGAALRAPRAFAGLLLVAPGGLEVMPPSIQALARAAYNESAWVARRDSDVVQGARRIFYRQSEARERLAARKLAVHRSSLREQFARPFARVVEDVLRHPIAGELARIDVPMHFVTGRHDVIVESAAVQRAARRVTSGIDILEETGHLPMVEAPARFAEVAFAFARRVVDGRGRERKT